MKSNVQQNAQNMDNFKLCTKAYVTFWLYFVWAFCTYRKLN